MTHAALHRLPEQRHPTLPKRNSFGGVTLSEESLTALATLIPEHMQRDMLRYIERCEPVCGWLIYVLSNDLVNAGCTADSTNATKLADYAAFLAHHAPPACYGSKAKVRRWLAKRWR